MKVVNKSFNKTSYNENKLSEPHKKTKKLYEFKRELRDLGLSESEIINALKFQSY